MNIQDFYRNAVQKDFARNFQFRVEWSGDDVVDFDYNHNLYIETASLPGRTINNVTVPYMGLNFNVPGTASYPGSDSYAVTFRCDETYDLRSILEARTFRQFDDATSTGVYRSVDPNSILRLLLLDNDMSVVRSYTLFGAYIKSLGDAQYDIKDSGTVQTIQATIAYQFWRAESGGGTVTDPEQETDGDETTESWG